MSKSKRLQLTGIGKPTVYGWNRCLDNPQRVIIAALAKHGLQLDRMIEMILDHGLSCPVTKINSSIPAAHASSTAYWISGLSIIGSISFGIDFVAGRKRVPRPPTGKIAFRTGTGMSEPLIVDWVRNRTIEVEQ